MSELPRFWFGQAVIVHWLSEDRDRVMTDSGVIVGIAWKAPDLPVDGWWYAIEFSQMDSCHWLPAGHIDWAQESEVCLVEQLRS